MGSISWYLISLSLIFHEDQSPFHRVIGHYITPEVLKRVVVDRMEGIAKIKRNNQLNSRVYSGIE